MAYNAATGARVWASRYAGPVGGSAASAVAVSPDGNTVFVTGGSSASSSSADDATVAYDAATGAQRWASTDAAGSFANSVAVGPHGHVVYVTGVSGFGSSNLGALTVAYNAADGAQLWVRRYHGPAAATTARTR